MIRHIVLFQFKETPELNLSEMKVLLESLSTKVNEIIRIEARINTNPNEAYHLALIVDVADFDALKRYAQHHEHLAVGKVIRQHLQSRACVDYEL